ncbi:helix-turn-helix domain-containing protein [Butyricicoccus faecihominis]|uniref:helix-turn-helix domain-containing protein n=1 Tax=Butyricicoccus faecihominis TaxID=1712515 RepID=UPI00247832B9|nr:helix-turn-helix transcriptional regulator [Butyricicoccus faecihominis]MCQ5129106.1 helix-turn-helix domain-containing protein [Butyricicoccus faecihominis]
MGERIREIRQALKLNQAQFGKRLGVTNTAISKLEHNENQLTDQMLIVICEIFNVNEIWLRTGEGEMFVELTPDEEFAALCGEISCSNDDLTKKALRSYWKLDENGKAIIQQLIKTLSEQNSK